MPLHAHDEWFLHSSSRLVGIPSPPCRWSRERTGSLRIRIGWEGARRSRRVWWQMAKRGGHSVLGHLSPSFLSLWMSLSKIYAFRIISFTTRTDLRTVFVSRAAKWVGRASI